MPQRNERIADEFRKLAATFLERESNRLSLITVTGVQLGTNMRTAAVLLSIYPEERQDEALSFANRHAGEFRNFVRSRVKTKHLPHFSFILDGGEINRQRIDDLLRDS